MQTGDQTEEFSDENKSIVWFLMKQVRPGMDLSRVVLPTFILEPRSFLDKISDYYYHADIISKVWTHSGGAYFIIRLKSLTKLKTPPPFPMLDLSSYQFAFSHHVSGRRLKVLGSHSYGGINASVCMYLCVRTNFNWL